MPPKRRDAPSASTLSPLELQRVVTIAEAARMTGLSEDSLRRHHSDKFVRLSPKRIGMTLSSVLSIPQPA